MQGAGPGNRWTRTNDEGNVNEIFYKTTVIKKTMHSIQEACFAPPVCSEEYLETRDVETSLNFPESQ